MRRPGAIWECLLRCRRGFTLIEAIVSLVIVSVMLVAALDTLGAARMTQYRVAERSRALALAQDLMAEILQQAYADPEYGPDSFGVGADEAATGDRSLYEDVDDYNGWSASPPEFKDGTTIPDADEYGRSVAVAWVGPADLEVASGGNTGIKRIIVTVSHQDREIITLIGYRTQAWTDPAELQGGNP